MKGLLSTQGIHMLYQAYQLQSDLTSPVRLLAQWAASALWTDTSAGTWLRRCAAGSDVLSRLRLTHTRPDYGIEQITSGPDTLVVEEHTTAASPFGSLLHFRKLGAPPQPAVMLIAPLSGHFATLLRETARTLLQDHDVYITDWHNARDVPLRHGAYGLDDYIDNLMAFSESITAATGQRAHWVAVCQPCVAALAATALMAEDDHHAQPQSLTLMAGPVDCRVNPTEVNKLAVSKPIEWFEQNLLSTVPLPHAGFMRKVYPGFLQLSAFISMNPERHKQSFKDLYRHLVDGEMDKAESIRQFYEEYLAVNDLPAEFYLETVEKVFQTYDLPRGVLQYRNRTVNTRAIRRTALLTVEGERDDICAVGQTVAAQDLCPSIRPYLKTHHVQTGVGHYGVFSGRRWNQQIYPRVRDVIHASMG
jgi:poly(3-hydroxybutyrate) depolymerase